MSLDLHVGADVVSRDGRKLGTLSRVVVNKDTLSLTHVVVDTGILRSGKPLWEGGWSLPHDRVVPLAALSDVGSDRIELTMSADEFRDYSVNYDTDVFRPIPDLKPGRLDASDLQRFVTSLPGEPGPFVITDVMAKAPGEVDIKKDSPVWRLNPHEKIGEVERVIVDEPSRKVTALVIRRGFVFSHEVVLPVHYVVEVIEALGGIVHVDMDDGALKQLAEFREAEEG
jgi:sporulation protein YlmC with PRC-barrel domain